MRTNFAGWTKATVSTFSPCPPSSPFSSTSFSSSVLSKSSGFIILSTVIYWRNSRTKLHFENNFNRNHTDINMMMKSAKVVFILVPIFGIHFLLLPIRPAKNSSLEYPYEVDFIPMATPVPAYYFLSHPIPFLNQLKLHQDRILPLDLTARLLHLHPPLLCQPWSFLSDKVVSSENDDRNNFAIPDL